MALPIEKWTEVSREEVFKKYGRAVDKVVYRLPNGSADDFYIKREPDAVGIFAITPDQQVVLVEQYRPGPDAIVVDVPCGYIDAGETPEHAAARELLEETGYTGELSFVGTFITDAYSTVRRHGFVAINCTKVAEPTPDAGEFLAVKLMSVSEYRAHLKKGMSTFYPLGYAGLEHIAGLL